MNVSLASRLRLLFLTATACSLSALAAPPTVTLDGPEDGSIWGPTRGLRLKATALDADGPVVRVEFYVDDILLATGIRQYGTATFEGGGAPIRPPAGTYALTARAYDQQGETTTSSPRVLIVEPMPELPTVVTGPAVIRTSNWMEVHATITSSVLWPSDYECYFEYGLTDQYGRATPKLMGGSRVRSSSRPTGEPYDITGFPNNLERSTTYHYRVVLVSWAGTAYGEDATFTTPANMEPVASDGYAHVPSSDPVPVYCDIEDPDREPLTITVTSPPAHGTVVVGSDVPGADFTYTPGSTFDVEDEFTYTVTDQHGGSTSAKGRLVNVWKAGPGKYASTVITDGGGHRAVGVLGMVVNSSRYCTAVLSINGQRYPFIGRFSLDGYLVLDVDRVGAAPFTVSLSLLPGRDGVAMGGHIWGSLGMLEVLGSTKLIFPANAPEAGSYTMALPPDDSDAPLGNGYITGRVSKRGRVVFAGRIGDGQPVSFGTQLRVGGKAEVYMTAGAAPRDRLHGDVQFPGAGVNECKGEFAWHKAPRSSGYFPNGLNAHIYVTGSRLLLSDEEDAILDYSTELAGLDLSFEDLEGEPLLEGLLSGANEQSLTFHGGAPTVTIKVNRKNGLFSGRLRNPAENGKVRKFSGVMLQHQNIAAGVLMFGKAGSGVTMTPR